MLESKLRVMAGTVHSSNYPRETTGRLQGSRAVILAFAAPLLAGVIGCHQDEKAGLDPDPTAAVVARVEIQPDSVSVPSGDSAYFQAIARGSDGNAVSAPITWSATGGTFDPAGFFHAGAAVGQFRVVAAVSGVEGAPIADTAVVVIPAPPPPPPPAPVIVRLLVTPDTAELVVRDTTRFSAETVWSDSSHRAAAPAWTATGGTVTIAGLYTAGGATGTFRVVGSVDAAPGVTVVDTTWVIVKSAPPPPPPVLQAIVVAPHSVAVVLGAAQAFTAKGTYSDGSQKTTSVTWAATGGTVTSAGIYSAGTSPGTYRVVATAVSKPLADTATVVIPASPPPPPPPPPPSGPLGVDADLYPRPLFPADNPWNQPVDTAQVDPNSSTIISAIGLTKSFHPDFGAFWNGGPFGIPYLVVAGNTAKVPVTFDSFDESDPGPYPIPPNAPIEGGASSGGDRHVLIVDRDNWKLYELFAAYPQTDGSWRAGSGAVFDLQSNALRPIYWTSADAAGLPILPGLARYDEVVAGAITHALRFTVSRTRRAFMAPARHWASSDTSSTRPPMGMRVRLKASFDVSAYPPSARVILTALQKYGMIVADNGSDWYLSGVADPRWNDNEINMLKQLKGSDFEVVLMAGVVTH